MTLRKALFAQKHVFFSPHMSTSLTKKYGLSPPKTYFTYGHHNYQNPNTKNLLYQEKESLILQGEGGLNIYRLKVFGIVNKAY